MSERSTADEIAMALGVALVRKGVLNADDLVRAADDSSPDAAHALRIMAIEGNAPSQADWEAGRRRLQMRVVKD